MIHNSNDKATCCFICKRLHPQEQPQSVWKHALQLFVKLLSNNRPGQHPLELWRRQWIQNHQSIPTTITCFFENVPFAIGQPVLLVPVNVKSVIFTFAPCVLLRITVDHMSVATVSTVTILLLQIGEMIPTTWISANYKVNNNTRFSMLLFCSIINSFQSIIGYLIPRLFPDTTNVNDSI